ncbi:MAG: hypothetical protein IID32_12390 [Planctomycetes bacterium]|nr:hypothetical protein [Planctomycetota bacterium]
MLTRKMVFLLAICSILQFANAQDPEPALRPDREPRSRPDRPLTTNPALFLIMQVEHIERESPPWDLNYELKKLKQKFTRTIDPDKGADLEERIERLEKRIDQLRGWLVCGRTYNGNDPIPSVAYFGPELKHYVNKIKRGSVIGTNFDWIYYGKFRRRDCRLIRAITKVEILDPKEHWTIARVDYVPPWPKIYAGPVMMDTIIGDMRLELVELWLSPVYAPHTNEKGSWARYRIRDESLLIVLRLTNTSTTRLIRYVGWRPDQSMEASQLVTVFDNQSNFYQGFSAWPHPNGGLKGGVTFRPGQVEQEILVFEVPVEDASTLTIRLPNDVFGIEGETKLKIDLSKVLIFKEGVIP